MVQRVDRRGIIDPGSAGISLSWCGLDLLLSPVPVRLEMTPLGVIFQPCQILSVAVYVMDVLPLHSQHAQ